MARGEKTRRAFHPAARHAETAIQMTHHDRSVFRPCIDLHAGVVKQIVGASLSDTLPDSLKTNFVAKYDC